MYKLYFTFLKDNETSISDTIKQERQFLIF